MFQNGVSEEVPNYFVQEDAAKHHVEPLRPYQQVDHGMFRNTQYVDPRAAMLGQQFQQFPYVGAAGLSQKLPNGEYFDPRMQNRGQIQQPQHQQQLYEPMQAHQQPAIDQAAYQAMLAEKYFMGHGQGFGMPVARPQMVQPQADNFPMNMRSMNLQQASPVYGLMNDGFGSQFGGKQSVNMFAGGREGEGVDSLHDLFGGVDKLFADDPVQENSKSAIPGFGSLGASLINGCEAELFGDSGSHFFGQNPFKQPSETIRNNAHMADRQLDHGNYSQGGLGQMTQFQGPNNRLQQQMPPASPFGQTNDGHFQQYGQGMLQQQPLTRTDERWQNSNAGGLQQNNLPNTQQSSQMSRGTLQLFKDIDENDSNGQAGYQSTQSPLIEQSTKSYREPKVDSQDAFRPTFTLGVQDGQYKGESTPVRFPQNSTDGGVWLKDTSANASYQSPSAGPPPEAGSQASRLQPDRLLLDSGKPETPNIFPYANLNSGGSLLSQQNSQNGQPFRPRSYLEGMQQQKQQIQGLHEVQSGQQLNNYPNGNAVLGDGKGTDMQSGTLSWNVSNARQTPSDTMQRGNALESSLAFKCPPLSKPVVNEKPSPQESTKTREELFSSAAATTVPTASTSSSTLMGGLFPSEKPEKQSSEKAIHESDNLKTPSIWMAHNQGTQANYQDINRRHFLPRNEVRVPERLSASRPEGSSIAQTKDDGISGKVFESSAPAKTISAVSTSLQTAPATFQQERSPLLQSHLNRVTNDIQRMARDFPGQPSGSYVHPPHKPTESDSLNDIVQLQHQSRLNPPVAQAPVPAVTHVPVPTPQSPHLAASPSPVQGNKPEQVSGNATVELQPSRLASEGAVLASGSRPPEGSKDDVRAVNISLDAKVTVDSSPNQSSVLASQLLGYQQVNLAAISHAKLAASSPVQLTKEMQPLDAQQRLRNSQVSIQVSQQPSQQPSQQQPLQQSSQQALQQPSQQALQQPSQQPSQQPTQQQQRIQAALQSLALKAGYGQRMPDQSATASLPGSSEPAPAAAAGQARQQNIESTSSVDVVASKKRKSESTEPEPLVPWRTSILQSTPKKRPSEVQWAVETNRLPEKDVNEEYYTHDESMQFVLRAKQRLKQTTHLMQNSVPPVPAELMKSKTLDDRESAVYVLARLAMEESCRMTDDEAKAKASSSSTEMEQVMEGFKDRFKTLEKCLQRLESLPLSLEFVKNMQYLDKICVTNRLMRCHHELFPVNYTSQRRVLQYTRAVPQPMVMHVPLPVPTIPEETQLVSL